MTGEREKFVQLTLDYPIIVIKFVLQSNSYYNEKNDYLFNYNFFINRLRFCKRV
jgi:hypothetical protein